MTKVSVIVPAYNTAEYLPRCLDSLVQQSLSDIEIICINDGSTDGSLAVMQDYAAKDNRIKVIDFKTNKGVSEARNAGIKMAAGNYVAFMDSDDTVDSDFYEKLYTKAEATGADIVKGDLKEILPNGQTKIYNVNQNILKYHNKLCFYCNFTTAIYQLNLIKKEHYFFNSKLTHTEDLFWLNHITIAANALEIVSDAYYNYWRREGSADSAILSVKNIRSAYVAYKHTFLNTKDYALKSDLDFSCCYRNYFNSILSLIFRTTDLQCKFDLCRLLFFIYHSEKDFFSQYISSFNKLIYSYFQQDQLHEFYDFVKDKKSFADLILANLRYNVSSNTAHLKLSVVIPVYNVEEYLKTCLDSVCRQTYKNLEIICVDDCSPDNCLHILNDYASQDKRIRVIHLDKNVGLAMA